MINTTETLCVIPCHSRSKALPKKGIKPLAGKPLMAYAIEPALATKLFSHVVLTTDSPEFAETARKYGAETPFIRPDYLSYLDVPSEWIVVHAVAMCQEIYKEKYDLIATIQPTTPLMRKEDIIACIDTMNKQPAYMVRPDSVLTVTPALEHPEWMFKLGVNNYLEPLMGEVSGGRGVRQNLANLYIPNGACYVTRHDVLMKQFRIIGKHSVGVVMPRNRSVDIDTEEDFLEAEKYLKQSMFGSNPEMPQFERDDP